MSVTSMSGGSSGDGPSSRRPHATMKDVATLAGVSLKTVSRVVNHEPAVSDAVRTKVEKAVKQLGYRHNLAASNLRRSGGRTDTIGVLLQDISNSFSASLLRALEDAGRERGAAVLASSLDEESDRERAIVANLVKRRVDGLVIMPSTTSQDYLAHDVSGGLPVVFVDRQPRGVDVDSVTVDNALGGRLAARHLLEHGHRRIAFLSDDLTIPTARSRYTGFCAALEEAGLRLQEDLVIPGLRSSDEAQLAARRLFDGAEAPTAVFAARNTVAVGALRALQERGLRKSVAIIGFDDFPLADVVGLTVIRQDVRRIGQEVAQALMARLDGAQGPPTHVVIEPTLVVRGSGELRPT